MASKVISFRFDDDKLALLNQHRVKGESESQTAMRLLLGVLGVEGKKPSIQSVDIVDNIRNEIKESLANGDIKDAISNSYAGMMGQFNGLLKELQELKKQFEKLTSVPLAPVPQSPINEQLTTDNEQLLIVNYQLPEPETGNREQGIGEHEDADQVDSDLKPDTQLPMTNNQSLTTNNHEIVSMLGCQHYMDGKRFNQQDLKENGIDKNIATNKAEIESILETEINTKNSGIQRFVGILRAMGFEVKGSVKDGYYITNPEIFN